MDSDQIEYALRETTAETDPTEKNLKLASICTALFEEEGIDLVVVGGSAIEFYTEGAYTSGACRFVHRLSQGASDHPQEAGTYGQTPRQRRTSKLAGRRRIYRYPGRFRKFGQDAGSPDYRSVWTGEPLSVEEL